MTHAVHPVTTQVPPGHDGGTSWFKCPDAVEEWCDQPRKRGATFAACQSGRDELFKENLDRDKLKDPESGVECYLATMRPRPFFVKDNQALLLYRFLQMFRCNMGQIARGG